MSNSRRHHYIPCFMIDNFADADDKVWIYNKNTGEFSKKTSKHIFFEWDRNNFDIHGSKNDNIEKMYADIDNLMAANIQKVLSNESISGQEITLLLAMVSLTKWRIPASDDNFYTNFHDIPMEELGLKLVPVDKNEKADEEEIKKIKDLEIIKELNRLLLSVQPLLGKDILDELHQNSFVLSFDEFPALLGDVPIIERSNPGYETLEDFIFPLSSTHTLICKRGAEKYISNKFFYIQRNLTTFHLAHKYVVCKSREQIEQVIETYSKVKEAGTTDLLEKYVFEFIK